VPEELRTYPTWWRVLLTGLGLWLASAIVTALTQNINMIPTVVLLGSFLVPATGVLWYVDHYESPELTPRLVARTFIVGGVLGVLAASLLESWLLSDGLLIYLGVGFIEEAAKLIALVLIVRHLPRYTIRDGIVLGATVGFGFAALESSGYALTALFSGGGLSLSNLLFVEVLRGVLAPVGHGLWTAIVGAALFASARGGGHLHFTRKLLGAYVLVSLLHGLWDSMRGIATVLTALLTAAEGQYIAITGGQMKAPSDDVLGPFFAIEVGGLIIVSIVGYFILRREWRRPDAST
jgi:RsiW-degrading membrane proteinase PrsW (M82 family)